MKIKNISFISSLAFILGSMIFLMSCDDDLDIGRKVNESDYNNVYENNAYLRDGKTNKASNIIELYKGSYTTAVKMGLTKLPTAGTKARVAFDAEYLTAYNLKYGTDFEIYPQDDVIFDNDGTFAINSNVKSAEVGITINASDNMEDGKTYAIPLAISEYSSDITISNDDAKHCIYFVKDMRNAADAYKGEDVVRGYLFFEINNVNPLNTLSFELENGKLLWDVIVLFAANINYDAEAGRPRIQCNPQTQFLLDNNETYLQPLRKRGVKVLLGLLGNHDMTGLAQLSNQGAKDFAREIASYCKAYNLDGVNYDDEYSTAPDPSNPALTTRSREAAARLCYETKKAMPDKLMTVFAFGYMYGVASVKDLETGEDVDAKEWIDIVVPNYGSSASPIGQMTRKECAGLASEYNLGIGGSLSASSAQNLINNGFGWYMGFDLKPTKFSSAFGRLSGAEVLYGSKLKPITTYYKHQDPKPYSYLTDLPIEN
ncbi:DUF1735 domain-containing protein [Dysgonomonas sp. 511]|uniref:BT_3987 domain-containing protein n=1 Tax=Dysgonomonas sp. 511 TaxID=2302930 RepID=UPI0013D63416|nr:DUF1735 domain-containing protein [Dysgonomonas sp. 511]NDV79301.1 DUF1735 domain-containing protein [Dysgonomonas sp. 511]